MNIFSSCFLPTKRNENNSLLDDESTESSSDNDCYGWFSSNSKGSDLLVQNDDEAISISSDDGDDNGGGRIENKRVPQSCSKQHPNLLATSMKVLGALVVLGGIASYLTIDLTHPTLIHGNTTHYTPINNDTCFDTEGVATDFLLTAFELMKKSISRDEWYAAIQYVLSNIPSNIPEKCQIFIQNYANSELSRYNAQYNNNTFV